MERLTRRTDSGKILLNEKMFPGYAEETLQRELAAFPPFMNIVERLCEYEDETVNEID